MQVFPPHAPPRKHIAIALLLLFVQALTLHWMGQPLLSASGRILIWVNNPLSPENSQQLADWYSLTHIVHGLVFYGLLRLGSPRLPIAVRLLLAMGVEASWEIFENTQFMIHAYRTQALAVGYSGDSIVNSLSDTLMMATGFAIAARLPWWLSVLLVLGLEATAAAAIRDNLSLNLVNFFFSWPALQHWQAGFRG